MQDIERYGLITLVFLVASVTAVLLWDGSDTAAVSDQVSAAPREGVEPRTGPASSGPTSSGRLTASTPTSGRSNAAPAGRGATATDVADRRRERLAESKVVTASTPKVPSPLEPERAANGGASVAAAAQPPAGGTQRAGEVRSDPRDDRPSASGAAPRRNTAGARNVEALAEGATAEAPRTAPDRPLTRSVEVLPDDNPWKIAERELGKGHLNELILELNPELDPMRMEPGDRILIPTRHALALRERARADEKGGAAADDATVATIRRPTTAAKPAAEAATGSAYVVRDGESAWVLAKRMTGKGTNYKQLAAVNPGVDLGALVAGQRLVLPDGWNPGRPAPTEVARREEPRTNRVR